MKIAILIVWLLLGICYFSIWHNSQNHCCDKALDALSIEDCSLEETHKVSYFHVNECPVKQKIIIEELTWPTDKNFKIRI